ncbi:MAG: hypothetical protein ABIJ92_05380 [Candidatus Aenigmatarchaeota archaeon]
MSKNYTFLGLVLLLAIVVGVSGCTTGTEPIDTNTPTNGNGEDVTTQTPVPGSTVDETQVNTGEPDVTFILRGEDFKFLLDGEEAPDLTVNEGDTVRIEFTSTQGFHDWVVDEFDAATERVQTDVSTFVEFVADQKGTFEYYCSVGSHRANGMKGNLIVM